MLWAFGCKPTVPSLTRPGAKVTRAELQFEMETLFGGYELRNASLTEQERWRSFITQNALIMVQSGAISPLGIFTAIAAFYGIGSAAKDTGKVVKNKIARAKLNNF